MIHRFFIFLTFATTLWATEEDILPPSKKIQLNMMWLNSTFNHDQKGLFPDKNAEEITQHLANTVSVNADILPIHLWYSSKVTSPEQMALTQENIASKGVEDHAIVYKDIWAMEFVKNNPTAFDHAVHPPYFLSDLARVALLLDEGTDAVIKIYHDLNFPTHSLSTMMDDTSSHGLGHLLNTYGFALSKNNGADINFSYENSFIALDTHNKEARHAMDFSILRMNTLRANHFAEQNFWNIWTKEEVKAKTQIVFTSFKSMFPYYHYLKGEYGIGDDHKNMPKTFRERVVLYQDPMKIFSIMNGSWSNITYKQGFDEDYEDYVGYQRAGQRYENGNIVNKNGYVLKKQRRIKTIPSNTGRDYSLRFGKSQSSFYSHIH